MFVYVFDLVVLVVLLVVVVVVVVVVAVAVVMVVGPTMLLPKFYKLPSLIISSLCVLFKPLGRAAIP